jgi:hypothetical protein
MFDEPEFVGVKPRRRRQRKGARTSPPAPPLMLVAATYDNSGLLSLTLQFDRAIDISAINPAAIVITDGVLEQLNVCTSVNESGADWVMLNWEFADAVPAGAITFSAGAGNGIVAVDDGGAWPGVTDVELPFP